MKIYVTQYEHISIDTALTILREIESKNPDPRLLRAIDGLYRVQQKCAEHSIPKTKIDKSGKRRRLKRIASKRELELSWQIDKYIEEYGRDGFTNDQIKAHFRSEPFFMRLWNNKKSSARTNKLRGAEYTLYHRDGYWYYQNPKPKQD